MEERSYKVTIGDKTRTYPEGTSYYELAQEFQTEYEHQIVLAMVDAHLLQELHKTV